MPTIFAVYNAKDAKSADDYEQYLKRKKIAFIRSLPGIKSYEIYRIDGVVGSPPNAPSKPPYQFVAKIEVSSLGDFAKASQTPEMQALLKEYDVYLEPSGGLRVFTVGRRVEPS